MGDRGCPQGTSDSDGKAGQYSIYYTNFDTALFQTLRGAQDDAKLEGYAALLRYSFRIMTAMGRNLYLQRFGSTLAGPRIDLSS